MSEDIVERLREHADRVAGGGPSESHYDPETLTLEHEGADEIEALRAVITVAHEHLSTNWRDDFKDEAVQHTIDLLAASAPPLATPPDTRSTR